MTKRFTDNGKFRDNWYRKLTPKHKCLWEFLISECSLAGIIDVDFDSLEFHIGEQITIKDFEPLNERIYTLPDGKIFIPKFIIFQQKELNKHNPAHKNIIEILSRYDIDLSLNNLEKLKKGFKGASKGLQSSLSNSKVIVSSSSCSCSTTKDIVCKKTTVLLPQQEVYNYFAEKYKLNTGEDFKCNKTDFILIVNLIKKSSLEKVKQKIDFLEIGCKNEVFWFTKNFTAFTIKQLSMHWNELLPILTKEQKEELNHKIMVEKAKKEIKEEMNKNASKL